MGCTDPPTPLDGGRCTPSVPFRGSIASYLCPFMLTCDIPMTRTPDAGRTPSIARMPPSCASGKVTIGNHSLFLFIFLPLFLNASRVQLWGFGVGAAHHVVLSRQVRVLLSFCADNRHHTLIITSSHHILFVLTTVRYMHGIVAYIFNQVAQVTTIQRCE